MVWYGMVNLNIAMSSSIYEAEKSNFHLHITGSLHAATLRRIANEEQIDISASEPLEDHLAFRDPAIWAAAKEVSSTTRGLFLSIQSIVDAEKADAVRYVELTINTFGMVRRGFAVEELTLTLTAAQAYAETKGVSLKIKFGVNRKDGPESIAVVHEIYDACPADVRAGIDLNGDESVYPTDDFVAPFARLAADGILTIIHAGEYPHMVDSLHAAIRARPARVAHAVASKNSNYALDAMIDNNIVVEVAPTSNVKLHAVPSMGSHPLRTLLDREVTVVFGSDDPAFFGSSMSSEFQQLGLIGMDESDILQMIHAANRQRLN